MKSGAIALGSAALWALCATGAEARMAWEDPRSAPRIALEAAPARGPQPPSPTPAPAKARLKPSRGGETPLPARGPPAMNPAIPDGALMRRPSTL